MLLIMVAAVRLYDSFTQLVQRGLCLDSGGVAVECQVGVHGVAELNARVQLTSSSRLL